MDATTIKSRSNFLTRRIDDATYTNNKRADMRSMADYIKLAIIEAEGIKEAYDVLHKALNRIHTTNKKGWNPATLQRVFIDNSHRSGTYKGCIIFSYDIDA